MDEHNPAERALAILDAMTEAWVEKFGIAQAIESIPVNCFSRQHQEAARSLILRHVKLAYSEGLLTGRISLRIYPPSKEETPA